jgi:hypothetical protein
MFTAEDMLLGATYLGLCTGDSTENYYLTYRSYKPKTSQFNFFSTAILKQSIGIKRKIISYNTSNYRI